MCFLYFVLGIFAALDIAVWAILTRKVRQVTSWPFRATFHAFFALQLGGIGFILGVAHLLIDATQWFSLPILCFVYIWHLLLAPVFLIFIMLGLCGEGALGVFRLFRARFKKPLEIAPEPQNGISRRQFLGTIAALSPPLLTGSLSAFAGRQLGEFRVRRLTIYLAALPPELDGMTIAHLSDLHVGNFTQPGMLLSVIETTNRLKADLVLFTGDLINSSNSWLPRALETLRAIEPEVILCEGNHDRLDTKIPFAETVKQQGFQLLIDETTTRMVRGVPVQLLGLRWDGPKNWQNRGDERCLQESVEALISQRDPAAFPILLAHHPHAWDYCGDIPLTLSGHTHGGQFMLNDNHGFGSAMFRYWSGLYTRPIGPGLPSKALAVSNGIGNWFPLRVNAPAEILHLTLRRG